MNTTTSYSNKTKHKTFPPVLHRSRLLPFQEIQTVNLPDVQTNHNSRKQRHKYKLKRVFQKTMIVTRQREMENNRTKNSDEFLKQLKESTLKSSNKIRQNCYNELQLLKQKEYKYFFGDFIKQLDGKFRQVKFDLQQEKNRYKFLNKANQSIKSTSFNNDNLSSSSVDKKREELLTDILYATKQLEVLKKNKQILKTRFRSVKSRTHILKPKVGIREEDLHLSLAVNEDKQKIQNLRNNIGKLKLDIKNTKKVIKREDDIRRKEKEELQKKITHFENFFSSKEKKIDCDCFNPDCSTNCNKKCLNGYRNSLTYVLNDSSMKYPMYVKIKLECLLRKSLLIPGNNNSSVKENSFLKTSSTKNKQEIKKFDDNKTQRKRNNVKNINEINRDMKKIISSVKMTPKNNKFRQKKVAFSQNNEGIKKFIDNKQLATIYRQQFTNHKSSTSNFENSQYKAIYSKTKTQDDSLFQELIDKDNFGLSIFEKTKSNKSITKKQNKKNVKLSKFELPKTDFQPSTVIKQAMRENYYIATDSLKSQFAKRSKMSELTKRIKSPESKYFKKEKEISVISKSNNKSVQKNSHKEGFYFEEQTNYLVSRNSSEKFFLEEDYFRNQILHSRSIKSFISKEKQEESIDRVSHYTLMLQCKLDLSTMTVTFGHGIG